MAKGFAALDEKYNINVSKSGTTSSSASTSWQPTKPASTEPLKGFAALEQKYNGGQTIGQQQPGYYVGNTRFNTASQAALAADRAIANYDPYQAYAEQYDNYVNGLYAKATAIKDNYDGRKRTMYTQAGFDPTAGGVLGGRIIAPEQATSYEDLAKLHTAWEKAQAEADAARRSGDYFKIMRRYGGTASAAIADFDRQIAAAKADPDNWKGPSVKELEAQKESFVATNTQYRNAAEDYVVLQEWMAENPRGGMDAYNRAQEAFNSAQAALDASQAVDTDSLWAEYEGLEKLYNNGDATQEQIDRMDEVYEALSGGDAAPVLDNDKVMAARRAMQQAQMIMDYAYQHRYDDLKGRSDFSELVEKGRAELEQIDAERGDTMHDYATMFALSDQPLGFLSGNNPVMSRDYYSPTDKWTQDQENTWLAILGTGDRDGAMKYGAEINEIHLKAESDQARAVNREKVTESKGAALWYSLFTTPANLLGGNFETFMMLDELAWRGDVYEAEYYGLARWADETRADVAAWIDSQGGHIPESWPILGGKGWGDFYQLCMSMADSSVAVAEGSALGSALGAATRAGQIASSAAVNIKFFGTAAASSMRRSLAMGLDPQSAATLAIANGLAEVIGETVSVDRLIHTGGIENIIKNGMLHEMLVQGGIEGLEEIFTTAMNNAADQWVNGDQSEFWGLVDQYYAATGDLEKSKKRAWKVLTSNMLYDGIGGFLSGLVMSGGRGAIEIGQAMMTPYSGDFQTLMDMSEMTDEGSESRRRIDRYKARFEDYQKALAEAFAKNAKPVETAPTEQTEQSTEPAAGRSLEEQQAADAEGVQEGQQTQDRVAEQQDEAINDQQAQTQERTPKPRMPISEFRGRQIEAALKEELSAKDRKVLEEKAAERLEKLEVTNPGKAAKAIVDSILNEDKGIIGNAVNKNTLKDSRARIVLQEMMEQLEGDNTKANWLDDSGLLLTGRNSAYSRKLEGNLKQIRPGNSTQRFDVKNATMQDGKLRLSYEQDGQTKTAGIDELALADYQKRALDVLTRILGNDAASAYNAMSVENLNGDVLDTMRYAAAFATIRDEFGRSGSTNRAAIEKAALASPLRKGLTNAQVAYAVALGMKQGPMTARTQTKSVRGTGRISFDGGTLNGRQLGAVQDVEAVKNTPRFKAIKKLAEELGVDIVLYESRTTDDKGTLENAPHGAYKDGVIWLDWNAGVYNRNELFDAEGKLTEKEYLIFLTMSHELTHFLEQNAENEYKELRQFITDYLANSKDVDFNDLVGRKMDEQPGISRDEAVREVIADACQTMLTQSKYVEQLINEKPTLWERIRDWIRNFFGFAKTQAKGPEFEAIRDVAAQISELWDRALQVAVESRLSEETLQQTPTIKEQAAANILTREQQQAILDEAMSRGVRTDRLADLYRQRDTVRNTPSQQTPLMLTAHEYTEKEKVAVKRRFNKAVEDLMDSYLFDGIDLSRKQAEQLVREYAAVHDGYFSLMDEAKQTGKNKTRRQLAEAERDAQEGGKAQLSGRTQVDRDYLAAVERGDMETAQRMVDEAAAAAGYNRRAFHGTVSKFWTFKRGKEGIHFGTLEVAQQTLEKDRSRHELSSYPLGIIRANLDRFNAEQLWNLSEELENLKWRGYSDIPSLDPKTVYDNAEAVRGYMDKILDLHPEARSDAKIDMKSLFNEHEDRMIDAYIKMQHPMTIPVDLGDWTTWNIASALLHKLNGTTDSFYRYNREEKTGDWENWKPADIKGIELTEADRPALENLAGHYKEYEELVDFLHSKGVDSIEYTNMYEGSADNISYLLLDPEQIKLSDPVTYDDAGNVIPLSERFNSGNPDIRYSARTGDKSDRELLLDASDASLTDAEQKARAAYRAQVDGYRSRQQAVVTLIDSMDKAVRDGDAVAATKLRAKLTEAEKKMAQALAGLTEAERGPELREILRREREIQRRRTDSRIRESYGRRELRQKVDRLWKDLTKRLSSPSEKKNIPVNVMMQAVDVLEAINMDATRADSKAGQKLRDRLNELKSRYNALKNDPDFRQAAMYDAQVAEFLDNMIETVGDTPINRMSAQQLAAVYNTLKALDHVARSALKVRLRTMEYSAYDISKRMTEETRSVGKQKTGAIDMFLNAGLSPARMFNRLGGYHKDSTWSQVYEMLNEGQLRQTQLLVEGSMLFEDLLAAKDYGKFVDPKNTVDVGLKDADGKTIEITHGMLVSLYMHLMNEQNRRHVAYGGLTIPGLTDYYNDKKNKGTENAKSAAGVLQEIAEINDRIIETDDPALKEALEAERDAAAEKAMSYLEELQKAVEGKLTEYDRKWIAACRELFDGFSKRALNEATMQVYGIKRANVENYFPIWVDGNFLNTPFESVAKDFSLENAGFMKERVDSAKPIMLADVSDVAASQIRKVAQYAGLMPVIHDFNKIWGKTQTGYRDSVRQAVMQTYGQSGVNYIENLMADLNGARGMENSPLGEMLNRLRGHMAQASLTLSLRTAMGQVASYPTAAAVLGWDAIRQGITNYRKVDPELILKWSPLLKYRMQGFRDPELGQIAQMNSKFDRAWKKARWATGWIQAADGFTVGQLVWSASEAYVQIHDKSLKKGTDAYYEAVAKKFNEAVELTQPNYTTMQRPDILRNPNALVRQLTMFLTQRLQNFNIMYDAAATYSQMRKDRAAGKYGVTNEDVRQAGIRTRTAALSQITAAATIVAFKFLADMILHSMNAYRDDDDELTKESVSAELLDMFLDSLAGNVLGGGELYDLIESKAFGKTYYGIEVSGVSTVTDALKAVNDFYDKVAKGEVSWKEADKLAKKISVIAGIPYANAEKIIRGGIWHVQDMINGEFGSFEAGVDRTTGQQAHRLWRAYDAKDFAQAKKIRDEVGDDDKLNQTLAAYIKKQYADGKINKFEAQRQLEKYAGKDKETAEKTMREYSSEVETGIKFSQIEDSFLLGDITAQKAQQMLVKYGGLDAQTAKMKVDFWSYQNKNPGSKMEFSSYKTYVNKYQSIGLTVAQYESYSERLKDCRGVDADGDGKTDSGSKKAEVLKLIDSMSLTPTQKDQLYYANNYGASGLKDTPWHK